MIHKKYLEEFEKMFERHSDGESPFDIVKGYHHIMDNEGIETMGLLHHFVDYIALREART